MPNKTRNANRKKQLKNKRKSRRQQKKSSASCAKKTHAKNRVLRRRHVWQKTWTSRIECVKNVGGTQKKVSVWKQVLISAEDAKKICHSINQL